MPRILSSLLAVLHRVGPYVLAINMILYFVELQYTHTRSSLDDDAWTGFIWFERCIAGLFTLEYVLRIVLARMRSRYLFSSLGLIDLVSIVPFWIGFYPGLSQEQLGLVRGARTLRLLKMFRYNTKLAEFARALYTRRIRVIPIVLITIMYLMISSTVIYEVERRAQPDVFRVYGDSIWWAVVTSTTVGYGDKYPVTPLGQGISVLMMLLGISIVGMVFGFFAESYQDARQPLNGDLMDTYCRGIYDEGPGGVVVKTLRETERNNPQFLIFADTVDKYIRSVNKGPDEKG